MIMLPPIKEYVHDSLRVELIYKFLEGKFSVKQVLKKRWPYGLNKHVDGQFS